MRKGNFNKATKLKCLQCCDRHCCLCEKSCSTNIEIHHIIPLENRGDNSFENAIPLCFDCHAKVQLYNERHPKGNKYRYDELKIRRNQIYDKYTSHFVPTIHFEIKSIEPKTEPNHARFLIHNTHQYLPCKVKIVFGIYSKNKLIHKYSEGDYGGQILWHLNPNSGGDFPPNFLQKVKNLNKIDFLQVQIEVTIIDKFEWEHKLLPVSWIWGKNDGWYYHPFPRT